VVGAFCCYYTRHSTYSPYSSICSFVYQRVEEIQEIAVQETDFQAPLVPAAHQTPKTEQRLPAPSPRPRSLKPKDDEDDISHYTRVQFINTRFQVQKGEGSNVVPVLAMLHPQDLENIERLSEYLATFCDLSQEECQAALKDCNAQFLAIRAEMDMEDAFGGYDDGYDADGYDNTMDECQDYLRDEGGLMIQQILEDRIRRQAAYRRRWSMTHSEAGTRGSYSQSIISDVYTDEIDTVEEEDEEGLDQDSSMNDFTDDGEEDQGPIRQGQRKRAQTRILDHADGSRGLTGPVSSTLTDASGEQELDEDMQALLCADGWMLQHDGDDDSDDDSDDSIDSSRATVGWDATAISDDRVRSPTPIRPPSRVGNPRFMDGSRGPRRRPSIESTFSTTDDEDSEAADNSDFSQDGDMTMARYAPRQRPGNPWGAFVEQPHGIKARNSRPRLRDQSSTATLRAVNFRQNIRDSINPPQRIRSQAPRINLGSQPPVAVGTGAAGQPAPRPTWFTSCERAHELITNRMRALREEHRATTNLVRTNPFAPGFGLPNPSSDAPLTNVTSPPHVRSNSNESVNLGNSSTTAQAVPSSPVLGR
jgi:hypothetical protein